MENEVVVALSNIYWALCSLTVGVVMFGGSILIILCSIHMKMNILKRILNRMGR